MSAWRRNSCSCPHATLSALEFAAEVIKVGVDACFAEAACLNLSRKLDDHIPWNNKLPEVCGRIVNDV